MKNWRSGVDDAGPDKTERSDLPPTFTIIRTGSVGAVIATGPLVAPLRFDDETGGQSGGH